MGVYTFNGICFCCGKHFSFHPNKVPVVIIDDVKQPVCEDCVKKVNPMRIAKGLPPITYESDAYKTALDEEEDRIDWKE